MIGYAELLNARLNGQSPEYVWVHVLDAMPDYWMRQDAQQAIANGFRVSLLILPNESLSTLDLFVLRGLTVNVMGKNDRRSHEVIKGCQRYAERVIHCLGGQTIILRGSYAEQA